jgi:hypothetical protein
MARPLALTHALARSGNDMAIFIVGLLRPLPTSRV